jgi:hypothetical protein
VRKAFGAKGVCVCVRDLRSHLLPFGGPRRGFADGRLAAAAASASAGSATCGRRMEKSGTVTTLESAHKVAGMKSEHGEGHRCEFFCIADGETEGDDLMLPSRRR